MTLCPRRLSFCAVANRAAQLALSPSAQSDDQGVRAQIPRGRRGRRRPGDQPRSAVVGWSGAQRRCQAAPRSIRHRRGRSTPLDRARTSGEPSRADDRRPDASSHRRRGNRGLPGWTWSECNQGHGSGEGKAPVPCPGAGLAEFPARPQWAAENVIAFSIGCRCQHGTQTSPRRLPQIPRRPPGTARL